VIEGEAGDPPSHLIVHGHQSDNFNRPGCEWLGETITRLASLFFQVPILGDIIAGLSSPGVDVDSQFDEGRQNILEDNSPVSLPVGIPTLAGPVFSMERFATLDEPELFEAYERLVGRIPLPWLLLGHSHNPKLAPGVRARETDCSDPSEAAPPAWGPQPGLEVGGYLNTGTAGMMRDIVWFATIQKDEQGDTAPVLNSARLDSSGNRVRIRPYGSVAACGNLASGETKNAQWLDPLVGEEIEISVI
jgi:hypothetical protein